MDGSSGSRRESLSRLRALVRREAGSRRRGRAPAPSGRDAVDPPPPGLAASLVQPGRVELRRAGGRDLLTVIDPRPSVPVHRRRNLALLVDALDGAGIDHFLVPGFSRLRHRVAVLDRHRLDVCRVLAARYAGSPVHVVRVDDAGAGTPDRTLAGELTPDGLGTPRDTPDGSTDDATDGAAPDGGEPGPDDTRHWPWWRLFEPVETPDGTLHLGDPYGVDLEFWTERPDGEWVAPRRNAVSRSLPAASRTPAVLQVGTRAYRTFQPFTVPTVDTVRFPVDVVYTWVDGSDPAWRAAQRAALAAADPAALTRLAADEARFTTRDELRYSLRSIEQYAEWVRHVWIVTADQVPSWLDTGSDRVTVVSHRDIWHPDGTLPTFNSQAIEANLHRIPGLAEHYLYLNDDMLLGRPVGPELFFHPNGLSRFFYSRQDLGLGDPDPADLAPVSSGRVNRALIEERFGTTVTQRFFHTPQPLRRSVVEEMERLWPERFAETSRSTFRRVTDVTVSGPLHHYYAYCTGRATRGKIGYGYVNLHAPTLATALDELLRRRRKDTFCLNDLHAPDDPARVDRQVADFLEAYFPTPSGFERAG